MRIQLFAALVLCRAASAAEMYSCDNVNRGCYPNPSGHMTQEECETGTDCEGARYVGKNRDREQQTKNM